MHFYNQLTIQCLSGFLSCGQVWLLKLTFKKCVLFLKVYYLLNEHTCCIGGLKAEKAWFYGQESWLGNQKNSFQYKHELSKNV